MLTGYIMCRRRIFADFLLFRVVGYSKSSESSIPFAWATKAEDIRNQHPLLKL